MRGFRLSTVAWSGALTLAFTCSSCSTDSKSDATGATGTDDTATDDTQSDDAKTSSNDESSPDTREAGTSEAEDDGASEGDESDDSRDAPDDDRADDSVDTAPNGASPTDDAAQPSDPAGDGSSSDDSDDSSDDDDGNATLDDIGSETVCTQGDTRVCVGAGACDGGQICGSDGMWGACDCGEGTSTVTSERDAGRVSTEVREGEAELGPGFEAAEPLVIPPWEDDEWTAGAWPILREDIGVYFALGVSGPRLDDYEDFNHVETAQRSYDVPGKYCPRGAARAVSEYNVPLGLHADFVDWQSDPENEYVPWSPGDYNVVALQFTLSDAPDTGVVFMLRSSRRGWREVEQVLGDGTYTVIFSDELGELRELWFAVHSEEVTETTGFDYCVSDIQFIVDEG